MKALEHLKLSLESGSAPALSRPWTIEHHLDDHIARLEKHLKEGASTYIPRDLQLEAVQHFWTSQRVETLKDARLVSFGIALPVGPRRLRVIEDEERFPALLDGVDRYLPAPRQYRRCYQGLLSGYFTYDPHGNEVPLTGRKNWHSLRQYLSNRSKRIVDGDRNPQWVDSLQQHTAIFSDTPCAPYGAALLAGNKSEVDELREVLNISDSSWFMRELFLAQVEAAVQRSDPDFLEILYRLLDLLKENEIIRDDGLALVLNRFARLRPPPLVLPLRDAAVNWWGNPWLQSNSMRWGRATSEARAMVTEWLKLEFIEAFFTLLAEEKSGDSRRLAFWKRYVHAIEDIHFGLGTDAQNSKAPDFVALRKKMNGLIVPLNDPIGSNNAFIMRMGRVVIVEFSGYSNACYGYDATESLPFKYDRPVVMPVNAKNSLKHSTRKLWLTHKDGRHGRKWEEKFEETLGNDYKIRPLSASVQREVLDGRPDHVVQQVPRPPAQPTTNRNRRSDPVAEVSAWRTVKYTRETLSRFARAFNLGIDDLTDKNGNLWVRADDAHIGVNEVLLAWGFEFKNAQKGWWKAR
jgi:hypothetical protein